MKEKKVLATYTLSKANKQYIEEQAKKEKRSYSSYLNNLITKIIELQK